MILETDRIILRPFKEDDLKDLYEYASQEGVGEMAGWKHHESIEKSNEILDKYMKDKNVFAVELKDSKKVIGHIRIDEDTEDGRADTKELGAALNKDYHNRGIMTEAVLKVLEYLFSRGDIEYVYACCFQENLPSKRMIEKCGFAFDREGTYHSGSLNKTFKSFEYLYTREKWNEKLK